MTTADQTALQSLIQQSLAEGVKELGALPAPEKAPGEVVIPMDRAWAYVNVESTRGSLTDHVAKTLGGAEFNVVVTDDEIRISRPSPGPQPMPTLPAAPPATD